MASADSRLQPPLHSSRNIYSSVTESGTPSVFLMTGCSYFIYHSPLLFTIGRSTCSEVLSP